MVYIKARYLAICIIQHTSNNMMDILETRYNLDIFNVLYPPIIPLPHTPRHQLLEYDTAISALQRSLDKRLSLSSVSILNEVAQQCHIKMPQYIFSNSENGYYLCDIIFNGSRYRT